MNQASTENLITQRAVVHAALQSAFGKAEFYRVLALYDPDNRQRWVDMALVQEKFQRGEAGYTDTGRTYSETMRSTLHLAVIMVFSSDETLRDVLVNRNGLYTWFIRGHATAFTVNGAGELSTREQMAVVANTKSSMVKNTFRLIGGYLHAPDPYMVQSSNAVKFMRLQEGKPVPSVGFAYVPPKE